MQHTIKRQIVTNIINVIKSSTPLSEDDIAKQQLVRNLYSAIEKAVGETQRTESKQVNILLSDLRGFTALAEKCSSMALIELLNRYLLRMSEIILKYGGTIDKFMGDSIMVLFGVPESAPDDLERTLNCALEMQIAMSDINKVNEELGMPHLYMGIGINTGEVIAGKLGSELHSEYTVIGNEVNLASRVEAHCLRGQILLSENTYQLAKDYIETGDVNEVHIKGIKKVAKLYDLLSISKPDYVKAPSRESRRSPRVEVDIPLAFQVVSGKSVLPEEHIGKIIDISYSGIFAVVPASLKPHDEIKIVLSLSLMGRNNSDVYAKVLRVNEFQGEYECYLEFTYIDKESKSELKEFIDKIVEVVES